jgi:hypothetical protein
VKKSVKAKKQTAAKRDLFAELSQGIEALTSARNDRVEKQFFVVNPWILESVVRIPRRLINITFAFQIKLTANERDRGRLARDLFMNQRRADSSSSINT